MVVEAALLGVPVDTGRLYDGEGGYALWLESVLEEVSDAREQLAAALKS